MSTHSIKGFIVAKPVEGYEFEHEVFGGMAFAFRPYEPSKTNGAVVVCAHTLTFSIPAGWDPRPQQVAALVAKKEELRREFAKSVMAIDRQINQLLALEAA